MEVLQVENIHKKIGKREIIKDVSFSVKEGEIFGFLGPNGAGKTTTIRMMVGLIAPTKGRIKIMGHDIQKERIKSLKNVGCIVENPDMYNDLTGMQNLKYYADLYGDITKERINEVAELVGLKDRINDKVKKYSLGMKQRLGLGQAILSNPKLLILDEPTNGLDPIGMHEFREIVKDIAKKNNSAVFISSHILSEIEQMCDHFAIINKGSIKTIQAVSEESSNIERLKISTNEIKKIQDVFSKLNFVRNINVEQNSIVVEISPKNFSQIIKEIGKNDVNIDDICKVESNLENKFMKILEEGA
ncbi:ABC transporter ATP-binding protein [Clostridium sporogenes]|uniref:ABC transporter ATP-binding protein n=1 Tax=Clostridium sporogenes TaxID=1509 RepID=A0ABX4KAA3_CLOSG|nr:MULTISPECIES: ABC transporter ATP-binding protein [Clostridium]AVP61241.1 ABC transporter ATP-binding protein [Clostridium botulinum]EHN15848.1 bacitracin ABC transporter, ATP-binding protein [Clostridium sporogenes PA 3679]KOY67096.1 bacitracin ABC transporter ATP-binding protein [Clostridium sporogenes]MBA4507231.1 ABC transporter ATP-binding protein [Clostridium sporogenes]MBW5458019.1 ATP-binding cassette domain-containing protein [Clostridium sporogenes]